MPPETDLSHHRILITNDDGIHAKGLRILESVARRFTDDVWVVAPDHEMSGASHSISMHTPIRLRKLGDRRYSVVGTPTDCALMAVYRIVEGPPPHGAALRYQPGREPRRGTSPIRAQSPPPWRGPSSACARSP